MTTVVSSWRDGEQLAEAVPVDSGEIEADYAGQVPGRLDLTVPSPWAPQTATDPLGVYGQQLHVSQVLTLPDGSEASVQLGWWLVQGWQHEPPAVSVEGLSLDQLIADYRFTSPYRRPAGATYAGQLAEILSGVLPVDTSAMANRPLPGSLTQDWEEDRLAAVRTIGTNWPADLRVDDDGVLVATPPRAEVDPPHITWQHGTAGAYVSIGGGGLRDEMWNAVVARGQRPDGTPVQAFASDKNPDSPTRYGGPFGRRPRFYESPLITSKDTARTTARTVLARELRRTATVTVDAPPDPRIELLDTAAVVDAAGVRRVGLVTRLRLPLTVNDGAAQYEIGLTP